MKPALSQTYIRECVLQYNHCFQLARSTSKLDNPVLRTFASHSENTAAMASLDGTVSLLNKTVFNPLLSICIPPILHYGFGQPFEVNLPNFSTTYTPSLATTSAIKAALVLAGFGTLIRLNARMNRLALNNNVMDTWNWNTGNEIALITGGRSA